MDRLEQYSIPFAGLAKGTHQFEFEIDDKFFEAFENSVIEKASVYADVTMLKEETMLTFTFRFDGFIVRTCDRCLEEFRMPVHEMRAMVVKFGEAADNDTDDVVVINPGEHHLNLAPHLYDFLTLMVPIRSVHPDDESGNPGCDPEFLKKPESETVRDETDPRWAALKKLNLRKK